MSLSRSSSNYDTGYIELNDLQEFKRTAPPTSEEGNPDLTAMTLIVEEKRASPEKINLTLAAVARGVVPFLNSKERAYLYVTAQASENFDPVLKNINSLQRWEILVENKANSINWAKLVRSPSALASSACSLLLAGITAGGSWASYQLAKMSVEYNASTSSSDDDGYVSFWRGAGPVLAGTSILGTLCCTGCTLGSTYASATNPRIIGANHDSTLLTRTSAEIQKCANEFKKSFPSYNFDLQNTTLMELKAYLYESRQRQLSLFFKPATAHSQPARLQCEEHVIDMDDAKRSPSKKNTLG